MAIVVNFSPLLNSFSTTSFDSTIFASSPPISPGTLSVFYAFNNDDDFYNSFYGMRASFAVALLNWFMTNEQNIAAVQRIFGSYSIPGVTLSSAIAATRNAPPPNAVPMGFGDGIYTSVNSLPNVWQQQYAVEDRYFGG